MSVFVPRRSRVNVLDTHEMAAHALASLKEIDVDIDQIVADACIQSRTARTESLPTRGARRHALGHRPAAGA
jgi:hypothetical protein